MGLLIIKMLFKARRLEDPQVSAGRQNREAQRLHSEALQNYRMRIWGGVERDGKEATKM